MSYTNNFANMSDEEYRIESDIRWYSIHIFDTITSHMQTTKSLNLNDRSKLLSHIVQYLGRLVNKPSKVANEIVFNVRTMVSNKHLTREEASSYFYHPTQLDILLDMKEKVIESIQNTLRVSLK